MKRRKWVIGENWQRSGEEKGVEGNEEGRIRVRGRGGGRQGK